MPVIYSYATKEEGEAKGGTFTEEAHGRFYFEFYRGQVVDKYEHNGYHDSYFYAVIYVAETDQSFDEEYGATAYAGGGRAYIDATPEHKALYADYLRRKEIEAMHKQIESVYEEGVSAIFCARLWKRLRKYRYFDACVALLETKNFRSEFRKSLRDQLERWLLDEQPKFCVPFSDGQADFLRPNRA